MRNTALVLLLLAAASPAAAHVVAVPDTAKAGSYTAIAFRVGHACGAGDATVKLRIEIPAGVASARPQVKPGWTWVVEQDIGADPKIPPTAVTFSGRLPDAAFDDFALLMKLPAQPQDLVFPVIQTCEKGESQWTEIPSADAPGERLSRPAPVVRLLPADAPAGHQH